MKQNKRFLACFALLIAAIMSLCLFAACDNEETPGGDNSSTDPTLSLSGDYYCDGTSGEEYSLKLNDNNTLTLALGSAKSGTYTYDGSDISMSLTDGTNATAKYDKQNNVVNVSYQGETYRFLERKEYSVGFNTKGGSNVESVKVLNGRTLSKPSTIPTLSGKVFAGWYKDSALKNKFMFDAEAVTSNILLYARYVDEPEAGTVEYTVSFDLNGKAGATPASQRTVAGVAYDLPTPVSAGNTFIGWWYSDYDDGSKLTRQYDEEALKENVTLYAVWEGDNDLDISVYDTRISWTALGVTANYQINIVNKTTGATTNKTVTGLSYDNYRFSQAGEYTVTVTSGTKTNTAYYKYHQLAKPVLSVEDNNLFYTKVENATGYYVTIECGTPSHNHSFVNNGTAQYYDFSACDMTPDGIKFTVTATAENYLNSVSEQYVLIRNLAEVQDIVLNPDGVVTWKAVDNADYYTVLVRVYKSNDTDANGNRTVSPLFAAHSGDYTEYTFTTTDPFVSLKDYRGVFEVYVTAHAKGYNSPAQSVAPAVMVKEGLFIPANINVNGNLLTWSAVEDAIGYNVEIDGKTYYVTGNSLTFDGTMISAAKDSYEIKVQAIAAQDKNNSPFSEPYVLSYKFDYAKYENGRLNWNAFAGAHHYNIYLDGELLTTVSDANYYVYDFTEAGDLTVGVSAVDFNGVETAILTDNVTTYNVSLDVGGGIELNEEGKDVTVYNLYKAVGDSMNLSETMTKRGYLFAGWWNVKNGPVNGGSLYVDSTFKTGADVTLYAYWTPNNYRIYYHYDVNDPSKYSVQTIAYDSAYTIAPVEPATILLAFSGWYTGRESTGARLTNEKGNSVGTWNLTTNIDLYPGFAQIFEFEYKEKDLSGYYRVSASAGIAYVTEITVPAAYKDEEHGNKEYPVLELAANAFMNCKNLVTINLPDILEDASEQASAFDGCTSLEAINVYYVESNRNKYYASCNGVLIHNSENNGVELGKVPLAKTGSFELPSFVTFYEQQGPKPVSVIPVNAFRYSLLEEIVLPYTVTTINGYAFADAPNLKSIVFAATPDGATDYPLTLASGAIFDTLDELESLTLPSRLTVFDSKTINACSNLKYINIAGNGGTYSSVGGVLTNGDKTKIIYVPVAYAGQNDDGVYTVPAGVLEIGANAFSDNTNVNVVNVSAWVTKIGKEAFMKKGTTGLPVSNTAITEVNFLGDEYGNPLTIEDSAFYYCNQLTELTLAPNVKVIGEHAFGYTSVLTKVNIESNGEVDFAARAFGTKSTSSSAASTYYVTDLYISKETGGFSITGVFGPSKLDTIRIADGNPNFVSIDNVVYDGEITKILYVPVSKAGEYVTPDTLTEISDGAFNGRTAITKVTIGANVTTIGVDAFYGASAITEFIFNEPEAGEEAKDLVIENQAFRGCSAITSIALPERTVKVGNALFYLCSKLERVVLPSTLEKIEDGFYTATITGSDKPMTVPIVDMFFSCTVLDNVTVAAGNTHYAAINNVLYELNDNAEPEVLLAAPRAYTGDEDGKLVVPATVKKIYSQAFYYSNIGYITFEEGVKELKLEPFFLHYAYTTKIDLPVGLTEIGPRTFYYSNKLEDITIPYTVQSIGFQAFYYASALTSVNFQETPEGVAPVSLSLNDAKDPDNPDPDGKPTATLAIFYGCTKIPEMILPERTVYIGSVAFGNAVSSTGSLAKIYVPSTVTTIADYAFSPTVPTSDTTSITASALVDVEFGYVETTDTDNNTVYTSNLSTIGKFAFGGASIKTLTLPASVTEIADHAFHYCRSLESITLSDKTTSIGDYAFYYCAALKSINVPATVKSIGTKAFYYNTALTSVNFAVDAETGLSAMEKIGTLAFESSGLRSFYFPETNYEIVVGEQNSSTKLWTRRIFNNCKSLFVVGLSSKVASIEDMFTGCASIAEFDVADDNPNFSEIEGLPCLMNHDATSVVLCANISGELYIPEGVKYIGASAFNNVTGMTLISLPSTLISIGNYAFNGCTGLTKVEFRTNDQGNTALNEIGAYAFYENTSLESCRIPTTAYIEIINDYTFYNDAKLADFYLPAGVKRVGDHAFYQCKALYIDKLPTYLEYIGGYAFYYVNFDTVTLKAGVELGTSKHGTSTASNGYNFAYSTMVHLIIEEGFNGVIPTYAFSQCKDLLTVDMAENSVTKIDNYGFNYAQALTTVKLPSSLTAIGNNAFYYCNALESVNIPYSVTSIGNYAFYYNTSLTDVTFDQDDQGNYSAATVGYGMFYNATSLEEIFVPGSLKLTVGTSTTTGSANMFYNSGLKKVTLGEGLTVIPYQAFCSSSLNSLESINIPKSVTTIGTKAFAYSGISEITFEEGRTTANLVVGPQAFQYTANLKHVTLPANTFNWSKAATTVSSSSGDFNAIFDHSGLESIDLPDDMTIMPNYMFYYCENLKEIAIPASVKEIRSYVFDYCSDLENVTFDKDADGERAITTLGYNIFYNCTSLTEIVLPDELNSAFVASASGTTGKGQQMFYGCTNLKKVTLPKDITQIANGMFYNCSSLTEMTIPATVTALGYQAFYGCSSLADVTFEERDKAITINGSVFYNCKALTELELPDVVKFTTAGTGTSANGAQLFYGTSITHFDVPETWTAIPYGMFYNSALESITIPDSVKTIGAYAFYGCSALSDIDFGERETSNKITFGGRAFYNCNSLKDRSFVVDYAGNSTAAAGTSYTGDYAALFENSDITEFTIPAGWKTIPYYAFSGSKLKSITIPATITSIASYAFANCADLEEVIFAPRTSALTVAGSVFRNDVNLKSISLPTQVKFTAAGSATASGGFMFAGSGIESFAIPSTWTHIPVNFFDGATNLKSITIPKGITNINNYAFRDCASLEEVKFETRTAALTLGGSIFQNDVKLTKLELPAQTNAVKSTSTSATAAGANLLAGTSVTEFNIPENWETIPYGMFDGATELTSIAIPASVTYIGSYAFRNCANLAAVTFGEGSKLATVNGSVFLGTTSLKSIEIPEGVKITALGSGSTSNTSVGGAMFQDSGIEEITLPENITAIPYQMFSGASNLKKVTVKGKLTITSYSYYVGYSTASYEAYAPFYGCDSLEEVVFDNDLTALGANMFRNITSLKSVTFNGDVTTVGYYSFLNATGLESVKFNGDVTNMQYAAFAGCTALSNLEFNGHVTNLGSSTTSAYPVSGSTTGTYVFANCPSLTNLVFAKGVDSIGSFAFAGNNFETLVLDDVTSIGNYAFAANKNLTSVTINSDLNLLGSYAFGECDSLTSVTFKGIVTRVGNYGLAACPALVTATFEDNVDELGQYAFMNDEALTTVDFQGYIGTYENYAFYGTKSLTHYTFPEDFVLRNVEQAVGLFRYGGIEEITLPENVTALPNYFFANSAIKKVTFLGELKEIGRDAFFSTELGDFTIPETVTTIGKEAFNDSGISSVYIPASVTSIGDGAFAWCYVDKFEISPDNAVYAVNANGDIYDKRNNHVIMVLPNNEGTYTITKDLVYQPQAFHGAKVSKLVIAEGVTEIPELAFFDMPELTEVVLPSTLTTIGAQAFRYCRKLEKVTLPAALKDVGNYAFANTDALTDIVIPEGVETFGQYVFANSGLTKVTFAGNRESILASRASLDLYMFDGCTQLEEVIFPAELTIARGLFRGIATEGTLEVKGLTEIPEYMFSYANPDTIVLSEGVTKIGAYGFNYTGAKHIALPSTLTEVGNYGFYYADDLLELVIPSSVKTVYYNWLYHAGAPATEENGYYDSTLTTTGNFENIITTSSSYNVFYYAYFNTLKFAEGMTEIDTTFGGTRTTSSNGMLYYAHFVNVVFPSTLVTLNAPYMNNYGYTENIVFLNDNMEYLPDYLAYTSSSSYAYLKSIKLPANLKEIPAYAFYYQQKLETVEIPAGVTKIGARAFYYCSGLTSLDIPEGVTSMGDYMFYYCSGLTELTLPAGLKEVGTYMFYRTGIKSIVIPAGVTEIPNDMFYYAVELEDVTFLGEVTSMGNYAFGYATKLAKIVVPKTCTSIGNYCFTGWTADQTICFEASEGDITFGTSWAGATRNANVIFDYVEEASSEDGE